ncbi:unnamed protein product, partial [Candidula unifasciata]
IMSFQGNPNITETIFRMMGQDKLVSNDALSLYKWIIHSSICQAIAIFGIAANAVNMICFVKQGFRDTVN